MSDDARHVHQVYSKRNGADPLPLGAVYVGRPTPYGNPFVVGRDGTREECVELYREWLRGQPILLERARRELRGRDLVCWCAPLPCHADVLLEAANENAAEQAP